VKGQVCQGCGKPRAGGGHRFCWACLGEILSNREPYLAAPASTFRYPKPKRRKPFAKASKEKAPPTT
jgi:hypothetical protein